MKFADAVKNALVGNTQMRVVAHSTRRRVLMLVLLALIAAAGSVGGYFVGGAKAGLDTTYVDALETLNSSYETQIDELKRQLVDARLGKDVDAQASQQLRENIKQLRDEVAALKEEVTFYKSLMAPSSVERGLQIAEFELTQAEAVDQFVYHLLLTQVEARRDWIQGSVRVDVRGRRAGAGEQFEEQVLSLTEIAQVDPYPLRFRFRYFQDLSGVLTLPEGFEPEAVVVTASRRGNRSDNLQRTFDWIVEGRQRGG